MARITSNSITFVDNTGVKKFLYIKYSNDGKTFTDNDGLAPGEWIGICNSNDTTAPNDFNLYTWSKIKGADGTNGQTLYTWIKYADDANGANMSDFPDGKLYFGISYNNATDKESTNPADYTWSLMSSRGIDKITELYTARPEKEGVTKDSQFNWQLSMPTLSTTNKYLWNYEIILFTDGDTDETDPVIIGVHGDDGVGIADIVNYYATSKTPDIVPTSWTSDKEGQDNLPKMTNEDKYLWNYEVIYYTNGDEKHTPKTIIGVYGDEGLSGAEAIDFQIYSVDGFEFHEGLDSIELKTVASKSGSLISSGATYQWKRWNSSTSLYENITNATLPTLVVSKTDSYALASLKCVMKYDGIDYEDYVTLTEKATVYTAAIKFFDGSNIFDPTKSYIIAYTELYRNNQVEETIMSNQYYDGNNSVLNGVIETDIGQVATQNAFEDGDLIYFIYKSADGKNDIVLGKYDNGKWLVNTDYQNKYLYVVDDNIASNITIISKEDVSKTRDINVQIYKNEKDSNGNIIYNTSTFIANSHATIIDLNDPIISDTAPTNVKYGQLWLDTSVSPYILKIYTKQEAYKLGEKYKYKILDLSSASGTIYHTYSENISISDNGSIALCDPSYSIRLSYNDYSSITILLGKFFKNRGITYYVPSDAEYYSQAQSGYQVFVDVQDIIPTGLKESEWVYFSQQNGGTVYTSKPESYNAGDLWILAKGESCGNYGEGTMLKAIVSSNTFNESHWTDSMDDVTTTVKNVKETFDWTNGLKIMQKVTDTDGTTTTPFYVHLTSERMGFHSVTYNDNNEPDDKEVVHIGINSAVIRNASFVDNNFNTDEYSKYESIDGALFDCNAEFNQQINMRGSTESGTSVGFGWKIESNGSLSLAIL